jgi:hypothetical protein
MKVYKEISLHEFEAWSGAKHIKQIIIDENKAVEFNVLIQELYPNGIDETTLNDILWFDDDWVFEQLGIEEE